MTASKIEWTDTTWNPARGCSMAKGSEKGGDPSEWPEDLRVREWPAVRP